MNTPTPTAQSIFLDAIEHHPPEDWPALLDSACGQDQELRRRVLRLLEAHGQVENFMARPAGGIDAEARAAVDQQFSQLLGTMIGPYKLLEQLGEGGMGIVYVAEQTEPVRRQVALKIIKPGMDTRQVIARFEAERQALAMMNHPNIARILDAGCVGVPPLGGSFAGVPPLGGDATGEFQDRLKPGLQHSGRPYFVMELVRGLPITQYCDEAKLSIRTRLALFVTVCQAVQHAHQKGIIHRDLKPGNVMITLHDGEPVAKIIDFGVAKAVSPDRAHLTEVTSIFQLIGTPLYMSPEQAELGNPDIDTRSDVYSLGVLLYELLSGRTPFDMERLKKASFDEMRRIIREEEPPPMSAKRGREEFSPRKPLPTPSTPLREPELGAGLPTPHARSTEGLPPAGGGDLRSGVSAGSETRAERGWAKLLRGELDWIVMKALEKDRNRRYESASALAADVQRYLDDEPVQAAPPSRLYLARKFVRRHRLAAAITTLTLSLLAFGMGATAWQAFRATRAEQSAEQRYEIAKEAVDKYLLEVTSDEQLASPAFQDLRRRLLESAEQFYDRLSRERPADKRQKSQKAAALHNLGKVHVETGKNALAHQAFERATAIYEQLVQEEPQSRGHVLDLSAVLQSQGNLWWRQGKNNQGYPYYQRSLALRKSLHSADPSDPELRRALAEGHLRLGTIQWDDEGRRNLAEAARIWTRLQTEYPDIDAYQEGLAKAHQERAYHLEAVSEQDACENHEAAVRICTRLAAANADSVKFQIALAVAQAHQGDTFYRFHRLEEARKCRQQAVDGLASLAKKSPGRIDVEVQLGRLLALLAENERDLWLSETPGTRFTLPAIQKRFKDALMIFQRLHQRFPQVANFQVYDAATRICLGELLAFQGETEEAIRVLRDAQKQLARVQAETGGHDTARDYLGNSHVILAEIYTFEDRREAANQEWAQAAALGVGRQEFSKQRAEVWRALRDKE